MTMNDITINDAVTIAGDGEGTLLAARVAASTGTVHVDRGGMTMIKKEGDFPHLIRNVSAQVSLKLDKGSGIKVNALGMDGRVLGSVKVKNNTFNASAGLFKGGVVAYEITR